MNDEKGKYPLIRETEQIKKEVLEKYGDDLCVTSPGCVSIGDKTSNRLMELEQKIGELRDLTETKAKLEYLDYVGEHCAINRMIVDLAKNSTSIASIEGPPPGAQSKGVAEAGGKTEAPKVFFKGIEILYDPTLG